MTKDDWGDRFRNCLHDLNRGEIARAEAACRALLDDRPEDVGAHQLMAAIRLAAKDPVGAEQSVQVVLTRQPDHVPTLVLAGRIARMAGDLDLAAFRFHQAAELDPTHAEAAFAACAALIAKGGITVSSLLQDLAARFPGFTAGWIEISGAFEAAGQLPQALAAHALAGQRAPSAPAALKQGDLLHRMGRFGEAVEAFGRAAALAPDAPEIWFKLGLALQDLGDWTGAEQAYLRALELRPELAEAETNLGIVLQEGGDLSAAKQAYGRALLLRPDGFGRIAQALTTAPSGELWLDLDALRDHLLEAGRGSRSRLSR